MTFLDMPLFFHAFAIVRIAIYAFAIWSSSKKENNA